MPWETWVLIGISAALVAAIAFGAVGREARRLDSIAPRAPYVLDDATTFVAENIPAESQARLRIDEVQALLVAHLRWMYDHGLQPDDALDAPQSNELEVTVSEDALVATLLATADERGVELLDDVDAVHVVDAHLSYFEHIGAVGAAVPLDDRL